MDAAKQLSRYQTEDTPCVIVLFDNVVVDGSKVHPDGFLLWPEQIDFGMYGFEDVKLRIPSDGKSVRYFGNGRAGASRLKSNAKEYVSAVSVLYEMPNEGRLFLATYHNYFARIPLPVTVFAGEDDMHLRKPCHPANSPGAWVRFDASRLKETASKR